MAKGWKKWVIPIIVLLVIVGIILGVLGGLGYFKKKSGSKTFTGGANTGFIDNSTTCIAPTITNVTYEQVSGAIKIDFNPPVSQDCLNKYHSFIGYTAQFYDGNGQPVDGGFVSTKAYYTGTSTIYIPSSVVPFAISNNLGQNWKLVVSINIGDPTLHNSLNSAPYTYQHFI